MLELLGRAALWVGIIIVGFAVLQWVPDLPQPVLTGFTWITTTAKQADDMLPVTFGFWLLALSAGLFLIRVLVRFLGRNARFIAGGNS